MSRRFAHLASTYANSLLVSTPTGYLLRLYCPVLARIRSPVAGYLLDQRVHITAIHESVDGKLCFKVDGVLYAHHHFEILTTKPK